MPKLAIKGGKPLRKKPFPGWPEWDKRERNGVLEVLESGDWGGYPPPNKRAAEFGKAFADYHGAKYCVCCGSGTDALMIALRALGVGWGDEVIVPALTFVASASCVLLVDAVPVFVDIDPETLCMAPKAFEAAITVKTKAVIPVHLGSRMVEMDKVVKIARKHGIVVIEDCAHMHGGAWKGKGAGSWGDAGAFSFQASKAMTAGEGGCIITGDKEIEAICRHFVNSGRLGPGEPINREILGFSMRMTEFQAAILTIQLERLKEGQQKTKWANMQRFEDRIEGVPGIQTLRVDKGFTRPSGYAEIILFDEEVHEGVTRDQFGLALAAEGVPCFGMFYMPIYKNPMFPLDKKGAPLFQPQWRGKIDYRKTSCPVSEKAAYHQTIWILHNLFHGPPKDADDIADAVMKVVENINELRS